MGDYELYHAATRKHKYIKKIGNRYFYTQQEIQAYLQGKKQNGITLEKSTYDTPDGKVKDYRIDFNKHKGWSDGVGVRVGDKRVQVYNTTNKKYWKDDERWSVKRHGRLKSEYAEDGSSHTLDLSNKKTFKKRQAAEKAREKELEDWQVSQGYRKTDAQLKQEKKENAARKRKKVKKAATKHVNKSLNAMKKQSAKGKKALSKFYKNNVNPGVTVTYDEAKLK